MSLWRETVAEKAQFGNLLKIAPFCGVQQWRLQSRDGSGGNFTIAHCVREKLPREMCFIETLLCSGIGPELQHMAEVNEWTLQQTHE